MLRYSTHIFRSIAAIFVVAMLFSCQSRLEKVRQLDQKTFSPATEETQVNAVYTDSGAVMLNLRSPLLLDYGNQDFPFRETPKGIDVDFFDKKGEKNNIIADYAILYNKSNLMDLQGNVRIIMADSTILEADQLYWNQKDAWIFTDQDYRLALKNGTVNEGQGFDSDENFNTFISRSNTGIHYIDEKE